MSTGRLVEAFEGIEEERCFVLWVVFAGKTGWLVGRLETVLTTLCLSWAEIAGTKTILRNNAQNDRYEIFFKLIKTCTPKFFYLAGEDGTKEKKQKDMKFGRAEF